MKMAGYLTNYPDRLEGERGVCYDYVLASNGLFIEAEGPLFAARVPVSLVEVRGLAPLEPKMVLRYGKVPKYLWDLALSTLFTTPDKEKYAAVTFSGGYHVTVPEQAAVKEQVGQGAAGGHGSGMAVSYLNPDKVLLDMHSHPKMRADFSGQDNRDETGLKLYAVVGLMGDYAPVPPDADYDTEMGYLMNNTPAVSLRVGVYGYFNPIAWKDVFEGELGNEILDTWEGLPADLEPEEVIGEDELHSDVAGQHECSETHRGGMRWYRRLCGRRALPNPGQ